MIGVLIFYLHIVGVAFAFTRNFHDHKFADGMLAIAFVAIIFSVGWTIAGFIVHFFIPAKGFGFIDSDTISLMIVTILESALYIFYFFGKKKQPAAAA